MFHQNTEYYKKNYNHKWQTLKKIKNKSETYLI